MSSFRLLGLVALSLSVFAGCAASTDESADSNDSEVKAAAGDRTAFNFNATLGDVTAGHATGGALGLWTNVELKFQVSCEEKFEQFSYDLRQRADGKTDLLVSAIGTRATTPAGAFHCQSIRLETKKITMPGILTKDSLNLVNLQGKAEPLQATTKSLEPIGLEVDSIRPLCPEGVVCVQGGTVVTLKTNKPVSCVDKIAPVSYAAEKGEALGKIKLAAAAIDMVDSRMVRCLSAPKQVEITLPGMIAHSKEDIELSSVGGSL